jgi:hypothetical protein
VLVMALLTIVKLTRFGVLVVATRLGWRLACEIR